MTIARVSTDRFLEDAVVPLQSVVSISVDRTGFGISARRMAPVPELIPVLRRLGNTITLILCHP